MSQYQMLIALDVYLIGVCLCFIEGMVAEWDNPMHFMDFAIVFLWPLWLTLLFILWLVPSWRKRYLQ